MCKKALLHTECDKIKQKRDKRKECFIKQLYDFGDRLELDLHLIGKHITNQLSNNYLQIKRFTS
jgi:hypothetical protein